MIVDGVVTIEEMDEEVRATLADAVPLIFAGSIADGGHITVADHFVDFVFLQF